MINIIYLIWCHKNTFQTITTPSYAPEITYFPSGANYTVLTGPECPNPSEIYYPVYKSHNLTEQLDPPVTAYLKLGERQIE